MGIMRFNSLHGAGLKVWMQTSKNLVSHFVAKLNYLRTMFPNWRFTGHEVNYRSASGMWHFLCCLPDV